MHRFLSDESFVPGRDLILSPEESHHLVRVLRIEQGQEVAVIDGRGHFALADVIEARPKGSVVRVKEVRQSGARSRVQLCFGLPKGPALEFIIRRATEIGVVGFQPLATRYSLKLKEWNEDRWGRILREVAKQCEELWLPTIHPAAVLSDWLAKRESGRMLFFCDEADRGALLGAISGECDLLVGAEGGWSDEERTAIHAAGAIRLGLGRNRLRAETAALAGAILLKHQLGEM